MAASKRGTGPPGGREEFPERQATEEHQSEGVGTEKDQQRLGCHVELAASATSAAR